MNWFGHSTLAFSRSVSGKPLTIGLVNNTSDRALRATERQFVNLLRAASPGTDLQFKFFTCPEIAREPRAPAPGDSVYATIEDLFETHLDGLIVTGMEPQARALQDEPVWPTMTRLVDWAEARAIPTIWSCLAAHAAILHLDGIARTRFAAKLSGIFECDAVSSHPLLDGVPQRWGSPHSRYNDLAETALADHGYEILSRSDATGADIFLGHQKAPFVFFQGHPEYEPDTLLHEYKRDVRRYLIAERDDYPAPPANFFGKDTADAVATIHRAVMDEGRDPARLRELCSLVNDLAYASPWRLPAIRLVSNWLAGVAQSDEQAFPAHQAASNSAMNAVELGR